MTDVKETKDIKSIDDEPDLYTPEEEKILEDLRKKCREEKWTCVKFCDEYDRLFPHHKQKDEQDVPEDQKEQLAKYGKYNSDNTNTFEAASGGLDDLGSDISSEMERKITLVTRDNVEFVLTLRECLLSGLIMDAVSEESGDVRLTLKDNLNTNAVRFVVDYLKERQGMIPVFGAKAKQNKDWFEKSYADKYWFYREMKKVGKNELMNVIDLRDLNDCTEAEIKEFFSKDQDWDLHFAIQIALTANYLRINTLVEFASSWIGYKFKGQTPGDLRRMMDVDEKWAQMCYRARKNATKRSDGTLVDDMKELKAAGLDKHVFTTAMLNEWYPILLENDEQFAEFYKMFDTLNQTPGQVHRDFNKVDLNNLPQVKAN